MRELLAAIRRNLWLGFRTARKPAPPRDVAAHAPYLDGVAKSLADKLLGPDGTVCRSRRAMWNRRSSR